MSQFLLLILFLLINLSYALIQCNWTNTSPTHVFKQLTDESHYQKWMIPNAKDGDRSPLIVKVRMNIVYVKTQEKSKLDIQMLLLIELVWVDQRLRYDYLPNRLDAIMGGKPFLDAIWIPKLIFTNEMDSQKMGTSTKDDMVTILPNGVVLLKTRILTSLTCLLHYGHFPFDRQHCHLNLDSLVYNTSRLQLMWDKDVPLEIESLKNNLIEFDIVAVNNETTISEQAVQIKFEEFSSLELELILKRHTGYYILNYYLPSEFLVIISWVSFWLEPSIVPARVLIGVAVMLTFIQLDMAGIELPRTSTFIANDIWTVTCTAFIFLSLAEFAFVNSIDRKPGIDKVHLKKKSSKYILRGGVDTAASRARVRRSSSLPSSPEMRRHFMKNPKARETVKDLKKVSVSLGNLMRSESSSETDIPATSHSVFTMTPKEIAIWIDEKSRIVFPTAFLIFNLIYWFIIIFN